LAGRLSLGRRATRQLNPTLRPPPLPSDGMTVDMPAHGRGSQRAGPQAAWRVRACAFLSTLIENQPNPSRFAPASAKLRLRSALIVLGPPTTGACATTLGRSLLYVTGFGLGAVASGHQGWHHAAEHTSRSHERRGTDRRRVTLCRDSAWEPEGVRGARGCASAAGRRILLGNAG
jgi:hypothetical protein